jgi:type IV secretory pathway VirB2 component (pilin)
MISLPENSALAPSTAPLLAVTALRIRTLGLRLSGLATALLLATPSASAQSVTGGGTGSLDSFLTNVANMITGTTGQAIAIIAVAICGIGAMFGAISARAFGGVVLGCAIVFSAAWIVGKITGSA